MATIDVINKLDLSDDKKLKLLALYVDSMLGALCPRDTDLQDFIEDVFNEDEQPAGTVGDPGPPGKACEPQGRGRVDPSRQACGVRCDLHRHVPSCGHHLQAPRHGPARE